MIDNKTYFDNQIADAEGNCLCINIISNSYLYNKFKEKNIYHFRKFGNNYIVRDRKDYYAYFEFMTKDFYKYFKPLDYKGFLPDYKNMDIVKYAEEHYI